MKCDQCHAPIEPGEEIKFHSRILCEDCYMDALSPAKACDPWAVYLAKSFSEGGKTPQLSEIQTRILEILKETGGVEPVVLWEKLQINPADLQKEAAALRHMGLMKGELKDGKIILKLW